MHTHILRLLLILPGLFLLSGCGRIILYQGPERPDTELAVVSRKCFLGDPTIEKALLDGVDFCSKEVVLLPGSHSLKVFRVEHGIPYDCSSRTEFDQYGYDSCRDDREKAIAKGNSPSSCYTSSYTTTIQSCMHPYTRFSCDKSVLLKANEHYVLLSSGFDPRSLKLSAESSRQEIPISCVAESTWKTYESH